MRIVKESLIFRLYMRFLELLRESAGGSVFINWLSAGCRGSAILNTRFFLRVSELWYGSKTHWLVCSSLNLPFAAAGAMWRLMPKRLGESALLSLIKPELMPAVFGAGVGILYIVPHKYFNNVYSLIVMVALMFLFLLCMTAGHYDGFRLRRIRFFALPFGVSVLFSFLRNPDTGLRHLLFYFTAFLAVVLIQGIINSRKALYIFICILLCAFTLSGVYGLYQSVIGVPVISAQVDFYANTDMPGRIYSAFDNPNNFAEILVMALPMYAAMFYISKTVKQKLVIVACALPPLLSILLTYCRSGWGALAAAMLVFFVFCHRAVLPAAALLGLGALPLMPSSILNRVLTIFRGGDSSTQYRQTIREILVPIIEKFWLSGTGLGSESVRAALREHYTETQLPTWSITAHAHNLYLQVFAEMGIFGLLAAIALLVSFFASCVSGIIKSPRDSFVIAAGMGSIAGLLVMGSVEFIWFYPRVMLMFWITIGITLAAARLGREEA